METGHEGHGVTMATIRATCPQCGDVEMTTDDVEVRVCADDNTGTYLFQCPICAARVTKIAESHVVDLLAASGVKVTVWVLPAELEEERAGEPISHDDLLDFHDLLHEDNAWFTDLQSMVDGNPG